MLTIEDKWTVTGAANVEFEWMKWKELIPYIPFEKGWEVKIVPPFACAIVRFNVKKDNKEASIYLDCYDLIGSVGKPYWGVYSFQTQDVERTLMDDVPGLLLSIKRALA
jgi:hypothetical protein